jgi:hypothetical protein
MPSRAPRAPLGVVLAERLPRLGDLLLDLLQLLASVVGRVLDRLLDRAARLIERLARTFGIVPLERVLRLAHGLVDLLQCSPPGSCWPAWATCCWPGQR